MKRQLHILLLMLATTMLLVASWMPHHHHDSALCTMVEYCSQDHVNNDVHTHHSNDGGECINHGRLYFETGDTQASMLQRDVLSQYAGVVCLSLFLLYLPDEEEEVYRKTASSCISTRLSEVRIPRAPPYFVL